MNQFPYFYHHNAANGQATSGIHPPTNHAINSNPVAVNPMTMGMPISMQPPVMMVAVPPPHPQYHHPSQPQVQPQQQQQQPLAFHAHVAPAPSFPTANTTGVQQGYVTSTPTTAPTAAAAVTTVSPPPSNTNAPPSAANLIASSRGTTEAAATEALLTLSSIVASQQQQQQPKSSQKNASVQASASVGSVEGSQPPQPRRVSLSHGSEHVVSNHSSRAASPAITLAPQWQPTQQQQPLLPAPTATPTTGSRSTSSATTHHQAMTVLQTSYQAQLSTPITNHHSKATNTTTAHEHHPRPELSPPGQPATKKARTVSPLPATPPNTLEATTTSVSDANMCSSICPVCNRCIKGLGDHKVDWSQPVQGRQRAKVISSIKRHVKDFHDKEPIWNVIVNSLDAVPTAGGNASGDSVFQPRVVTSQAFVAQALKKAALDQIPNTDQELRSLRWMEKMLDQRVGIAKGFLQFGGQEYLRNKDCLDGDGNKINPKSLRNLAYQELHTMYLDLMRSWNDPRHVPILQHTLQTASLGLLRNRFQLLFAAPDKWQESWYMNPTQFNTAAAAGEYSS